MLEQLKERVCWCNKQLLETHLVTMTSGNVSGRDADSGYIVIKPSGVDYNTLCPADLPVVDPEGKIVEGKMKPSVDLGNHLFLYKHKPELGGVVHTHSNYATAFAALCQAIPCCLTAMADEFGGPVPCTPYIDNQGDNIGQAILEHMTDAPAILLGNHGVFTFDVTPEKALKAAVMTEDVAKTLHLSLLRGTPTELPPEEIKKWWDRYHGVYGQ